MNGTHTEGPITPMEHKIPRLDKIDDPQRSPEPQLPFMMEDDVTAKPTPRKRLFGGLMLLIFGFPAVSAFVIWCFAVYAPTPLINAAEAMHPLTQPIVALLAQPTYRLPDGERLSRLALERPADLAASQQDTLKQFARPGRLTVDDIVLAPDIICMGLQFAVITIALLFLKQRTIYRILKRAATIQDRKKSLARFSRSRLVLTAIGGFVFGGYLIYMLLTGDLIRTIETNNGREMRDFPDFLYQAGMMFSCGVPFIYLACALFIISFSPKYQRAMEDIRRINGTWTD